MDTSAPTLRLRTTATAVGGEAVARDDDGRVVFVEGALAGEVVDAALTDERSSFARARLVAVVEPSPGRLDPACPEVAAGCGGCDLAHADPQRQRSAKAEMVTDALRRIGRLDPPPIDHGPELAPVGFRTTVRAAVVGGRAGLRRHRSHEVVAVESCRVAHPALEELLVEGRYGDAEEVTLRVGARTGERMAVIAGGHPDAVRVPSDVIVVAAGRPSGSTAFVHEVVAGHRFRISAGSFFQTRADGADALVEEVRRAVGGPVDRLVDLCCGVGLFAATVDAGTVHAVESARSAVEDAAVNLAHLGDRVAVVRSRFERWRPVPADAVVADPSRSGLARPGVDAVVATGAATVVLVSCDAGSLGRDAGLLGAAGYGLESVTLVDLFPDTSHTEVVSAFRRLA